MRKWIAAIVTVALLACLGATAVPTIADTSEVQIISAQYGHTGDWHDVKSVLTGLQNGSGNIAAFSVNDGNLKCSPAASDDNTLVVCYKEKGKQKYAAVSVGSSFSIPFAYDPEQPAQTQALMEAPLATSTQEKVWPSTGVRGFNFGGLIGNFSANPGNEGMYVTEETFKHLSEMGVNCLRIPIAADNNYSWNLSNIPKDDPVAPYRHHLEALHVALKLAEKYDMWIIPSGDNVVGRKIDIMYNAADGSGYNETLKQLWVHIAKTYGNHPRLLAYDLLNEPNTANDVAYYFDTVLPDLVSAVRAVDKNTFFVVEPATFALPGAFGSLKPIDDPKTVYSFHFYYPHQYTHQFIGSYQTAYSYPSVMGNFPSDSPVLWNKNKIRESVAAVRNFQLKYNATIWIGEFGATRWAGNAAQWIKDTISLWEEYEWDWCYHSYGGYDGFNPTFGPGSTPSNVMDGHVETELIKALRVGFGYNKTTQRTPKTATTTTTVQNPTSETTTTPAKTKKTTAADMPMYDDPDEPYDFEEPDAPTDEKDEDEKNESGRCVLTDNGIRVSAPKLEEGAKLVTSRILKGEDYETIKSRLPAGTKGFAAYKLEMVDAQGLKIDPDQKMEVTIPLSKGMESVVVYRVASANRWKAMVAYINEKKITFETDELGTFVLLKTASTVASPSLSVLEIVLICVAGAIALAEIVLVVIHLLRKRAKKEKSE